MCVLWIDSWCVGTTYGVEFPGYIVLEGTVVIRYPRSYMELFNVDTCGQLMLCSRHAGCVMVSAWEVGTSYRSVCGIIAGGGGVYGEISLGLGPQG